MRVGVVLKRTLRAVRLAVLVVFGLITAGKGSAEPSSAKPRIVEALDGIRNVSRPRQDGYSTVWEGDKYVQCHVLSDQSLSCEAAGAMMQPSLEGVLTPGRKQRLTSLGWRLDPSFGGYTQIFPPSLSLDKAADRILAALHQGYDADLTFVDVQTRWVGHQACPPRRAPGQNLAGLVDDSPTMAATAVQGCAYSRSSTTTSTASAAGAVVPGAGVSGVGDAGGIKLSPGRSWANRVWSSPAADSGASAPTVVMVETAAADPVVDEVETVDSEALREPRARRPCRPRTRSGQREPRERQEPRERRESRGSKGERASHGGGHGGRHK